MSRSVHPTEEEWERYLEGELTQARARELDLHRLECAECVRALADAEALFQDLAHVPPKLLAVDLMPRISPRLEAPRERRSYRWTLAAPLALAAGIALVVLIPSIDSDFRTKGALSASADSWVGIEAFSLRAGGVALRALRNEPIAPADALAFAYRNIGAAPFRYLMIFGVSRSGEVYWYYPEYTDAAADPISVSIESGTFDLPDRVSHELPTGTLYLYGLFTRAPISVEEIEGIAGWVAAGERLPIADSGQHILRVEVKR